MVTSYYPPNHVGGDAMHVKHLANLLASLGHTVVVVSSESAAKRKRVFVETPPQEKETIVQVRSNFPSLQVGLAYLTNRDRKTTRILNRLGRDFAPDIVHYHNVAAMGWQNLRGRWRTLYTVHDYWAICQRGDLLKYGERLCVSPNCVACAVRSGLPPQIWRERDGTVTHSFNPDVVLVPSVFALNKVKERRSSLAERLVHCPNFAPDVDGYQYANSQRPNGTLLFVGALTKQKGIEELIRAVLPHPTVTLSVAGSGPELSNLRRIVNEAKANARVRILGRIPSGELVRLYRNVTAVVIPSIWPENAPLVALEALAASTPVLGTRVGGLPEILDKIDPRLCLERNQLFGQLDDLSWLEALNAVCRHSWESEYSPNSFERRYFRILERGPSC